MGKEGISMGTLQIKRVYETPEETDGSRILIDRLWPRGIKKENAALAAWDKTLAPTSALRKAFGHDVEKFPAFRDAYRKELEQNPGAVAFREQVKQLLTKGNVTLLYGAKDETHNNAVVLREWLMESL